MNECRGRRRPRSLSFPNAPGGLASHASISSSQPILASTPMLARRSAVLIALFAWASIAHAALLRTVTVKGDGNGPIVRVLVGRSEREKACGIDEQLAGFALKNGQLL